MKGKTVPFGKAGGIVTPVLYDMCYNIPDRSRKIGK